MSDQTILSRLRQFLLALSELLFIGTLVELVFTGHTKEPIQFLPFILCGVGIVLVGAALLRPSRALLLTLRGFAVVSVLGSAIGLYEHVVNNIGFYTEIHPRATTSEIIAAALGGADPLVAPGILAVSAVLALAATYYHPALDAAPVRREAERWERKAASQ